MSLINLAIMAVLLGEQTVTHEGRVIPVYSQTFLFSESFKFKLFIHGDLEFDIVFDYWGKAPRLRRRDVIEYYIDTDDPYVFVTKECIFVCEWRHDRDL